MKKQYRCNDITFCSNRRCERMKCDRNPKHLKGTVGFHSEADFEENKDYCLKAKEKDSGQEKAN